MKRTDFLKKLLFIDTGRELAGRLTPAAARRGLLPGNDRLPFTFMRPPGAPLEPAFLERCTACSLCIDACPEEILIKSNEPLAGLDTPLFDTSISACTQCGLCIEACPEEALLEEEDRRMGRAVYIHENCLLAEGKECSACLEACPEEGAISIESWSVTINPDICTGCAFCFHACPADPQSIILNGRPPLPIGAHPERKKHGNTSPQD